jgi:hypothetical protein
MMMMMMMSNLNDKDNNDNNNDTSNTMTVLELGVRQQWQRCLERSTKYPKEMYYQRPFDGLNLLHIACSYKAPLDFFQRLYDIHPTFFVRATKSVDARRMTPVLAACATRTSLQVINFLLEMTPQSLI